LLFKNTFGKIMKFTLTLEQFCVFSQWLWNGAGAGFNTEENIWVQIAKKEAHRTFNEGHQYCGSKLQFSPQNGWEWSYTTTSGTDIYISQPVMGYGSDLPEIVIEVEIPGDRAQEGCFHFGYIKAAQANLPYLGTLSLEADDTPEAIAINNIFSGMSKEERKRREEERTQKFNDRKKELAARRSAGNASDECDEYEVEDYE
jgi:hypothetical protein